MKFKCNMCGNKWFRIERTETREQETNLMDEFPNIHTLSWNSNDLDIKYCATCKGCDWTWCGDSIAELRDVMVRARVIQKR